MGGLFGKEKKPQSKITQQDKAVLQLKQQRDRLKQYQKQIELNLDKDRNLARQCLANGRRERAKMLLRKKKYQEKLLVTTDAQLENLEKLTADLEFAQVEQQVLKNLKAGNDALKKVHEVLTIDEIERVLDETKEGVEKQDEINAILSGALTQDDEDNVMAELDELIKLDSMERENVDDELADKLPEVPTDELPEQKRKRKDDGPKIALEA